MKRKPIKTALRRTKTACRVMLNPVKERLRKHDCRASFFILRSSFLMTLASLLLTGCEHKELCYDHAHTTRLQVVFDWTLAPDADPDLMEVYFYPHDGGTPQRFALNGRDGGEVELTYGYYDVLCVSAAGSGTTANLRRGTEQWERFEVYTRDASVLEGMGMVATAGEPPRAEGTEHESGALAPDMFWSGRRQGIEVSGSSDPVVRLQPAQSVTRFTVEIAGAENLKYVKAVSGTLSGLSRGYFIGPDVLNTECVSVPFAMKSDGNSRIDGRLLGFGHCPNGDDGIPHKLVIYAVLADGSQWYYEYDVTEQVHDAPDPLDIYIRLDGLPLPKPITNGSGMQPSVDGWENVEVNVEM